MSRRQLYVLIATILGSAVVILDGTIVNIALPKIGQGLHAGYVDFQWIVDGYLLSLSALILLGGSLGDIYGRKKMYLIGLIGFGVSSLLCALAPNATVLIAVRVLQGIFGALLVPGGLSIINTNFEPKLRSQAIGTWTAYTSGAALLGPLVGGSILDIASWRFIFVINIPLIILCICFALPSAVESHDMRKRHVDFSGAVAAIVGLAGITYGLIEGPANKWPLSAITILVIGCIASAVFIGIETHRNDPMVDISLFGSRNFLGSNIMTFGMYGGLSGFMFALVIFMQTKLHYSSLKAGLSMLPVGLLMFIFAGRIGKLSARFGPRLFMAIGPVCSAIGIGYLYFLKPGDAYIRSVLPGILVFAVGLVLTVAPLTTTVMTSVNESNSGIASGINNAVSRVAGLMVIALLGLFGSSHAYQFAMAFSALLALSAGIISFTYIRNIPFKT
jgi:EmrB/QacA subfamily drug resistance transporter